MVSSKDFPVRPDFVFILDDGTRLHGQEFNEYQGRFAFLDTHLISELATYVRMMTETGDRGLITIYESGELNVQPNVSFYPMATWQV